MTTDARGYKFAPSYPVLPTGSVLTWARTLQAQVSETVSVKDFGAVGDGSTDDTAAIQLCFDTIWGRYGSYVSGADGTARKPIFFPSGKYRITSTIYVENVTGGYIRGQGSGTTILYYDGAVPNIFPLTRADGVSQPYNKTSVFFCNGMRFSRVEGITFEMKPGFNTPDYPALGHAGTLTVCFNYNWEYPAAYIGSPVHSSMVLFYDCGFKGGFIGMSAGDDEGITDTGHVVVGTWGNQCDSAIWINCWAEDCYYGARNWEFNAINTGWYGGSISGCNQVGACGIMTKVSTYTIQGVSFSDNETDILSLSPVCISACRSTSPNFAVTPTGGVAIIGCVHEAAAPGNFAGTLTEQWISVDGCKTNGTLTGGGIIFIQNSVFTNPNWTTSFGGRIGQLDRIGTSVNNIPHVLTFNELPALSNIIEGLTVSITDATTATQFATVSSGGGSNHVLLNSSGVCARGSVSFSAQPALNSTITFNGSPITFDAAMRGSSLAEAVDNLVRQLNTNGASYKLKAVASGSPHDTVSFTSLNYGSADNAYSLARSTSPASNATLSGSTLTGGTGPIWTVVGK